MALLQSSALLVLLSVWTQLCWSRLHAHWGGFEVRDTPRRSVLQQPLCQEPGGTLAHCNKETHFKLEFVDGSIILTRESFEIGIIRCQQCIYIIRSSVCVSVSHLLQNHWLHKVENGTVLITNDPGSAGSKSFDSVINIFIILIDKCSDKANVNCTSHGLATSHEMLPIGCARLDAPSWVGSRQVTWIQWNNYLLFPVFRISKFF